MQEHLQILKEQYRTEAYGPWHTRECYPWEYDTKIQELIQLANTPSRSWCDTEESNEWLRQQAKIFQNRADYIRQKWAKQEAEKQARKEADERFKQQLATWQANIQAILQSTQQVVQQATQHSTPPAPQEAHEEEANLEANAEITAEKQEQQPLYQATVEDVTESIAEKETQHQHGNSMLNTKSTLSSFPYLCTIPASRDPAACLSNALSAYQHALILGLILNTIFGYIEHSQSMEARGEG